MKNLILTIAASAFIFSATIAQNKVVQVKANKHENTRGANPNIKMDVPTSDVEQSKPEGYKAPSMQRGGNYSSLSKMKHENTRGANNSIKKDEPSKDVEKVRPSYSNVKNVGVTKATTSKSRGANTNIKNEQPTTDVEATKPANYEGPNTKGATIKNVDHKNVVKTRGANPNIKKDIPSIDIEEAKPTK